VDSLYVRKLSQDRLKARIIPTFGCDERRNRPLEQLDCFGDECGGVDITLGTGHIDRLALLVTAQPDARRRRDLRRAGADIDDKFKGSLGARPVVSAGSPRPVLDQRAEQGPQVGQVDARILQIQFERRAKEGFPLGLGNQNAWEERPDLAQIIALLAVQGDADALQIVCCDGRRRRHRVTRRVRDKQ
jgi:hypothetical protein